MAFGFGKKKQNEPQGQQQGTPPTAAPASYPTFIPNAGACLVTTRVREGVGRVKFMHRGESKAPADNGWRIFSEFDDEEFMNTGNPWVIVDFNEACAIEPALIGIYDMPVGSDLRIERGAGQKGDRIRIFDAITRREIPLEEMYRP